MTRRRALLLPAVIAALTLALSACSIAYTPLPERSDAAPAETGALRTIDDLDGLTPAQMVAQLEAVPMNERTADFVASVRPEALLLTASDGAESEVAFPAGEFHLSIAPYIDQTHECYFHNLTTCHGELGGQTFDVTVVGADGTTLFDDTLTAEDNGYVGFWLPSDIEATVTVTDGDKVGTAQIATGPEDLTCLTSLQLT